MITSDKFCDARIILARKRKSHEIFCIAKAEKRVDTAVSLTDSAIRILGLGNPCFHTPTFISLVYSVVGDLHETQRYLFVTNRNTIKTIESPTFLSNLYLVYGDRKSKEIADYFLPNWRDNIALP